MPCRKISRASAKCVDRDDYNVLFQPQEVNLWALGMLASGAADNADDIWKSWATHRYGDKAAGA